VLSKLVAGREKDIRYARDVARHGMVRKDELVERLATMTLESAVRDAVARRVEALQGG
jgi:hypothetical protein